MKLIHSFVYALPGVPHSTGILRYAGCMLF